MHQKIIVKSNREIVFELDGNVYSYLFENTIVHRKHKFISSLENGYIQLDDFLRLSREGEVPYPLFFLEKSLIIKIVEDFKKKFSLVYQKHSYQYLREEISL